MIDEYREVLQEQLKVHGLTDKVEQLLQQQKIGTYNLFGITWNLIMWEGNLWFQFCGVMEEYAGTVEARFLSQLIPLFTEIPFSWLFQKPKSPPDANEDGPDTAVLQYLFYQPLFAEAVKEMAKLNKTPPTQLVALNT